MAKPETTKISALTADQEARLEEYAARFIVAGYSTERADRPAAEDAARRAYAVASADGGGQLPYPAGNISWYPSPVAALGAAKKMSRGKASLMDFCFGSHEAGRMSWYAFFRDVCGLVSETEDAVPLIDMCFVGGWWMPYDDRVLFCERPTSLSLDADGNLHNLKGAALQYEDGVSVYAVRGVIIPEKWITREPPSAKEALTWRNTEQRAAACELIGWDRILVEIDAREIDADEDPMIGTLYEGQLPNADGRDKFLRVRCGTGRSFTIPVSRAVTTALEAQSQIWRLPQDIVRNYGSRT